MPMKRKENANIQTKTHIISERERGGGEEKEGGQEKPV